jgi:hypothetical protein
MGTNYYLRSGTCATCGRPDDELHIGKSSSGWTFGLRIYPERGICDLIDWQREWAKPGRTIVNEYGDELDAADMLEEIEARGSDKDYGPDRSGFDYAANSAVPGPRGLVRRRIGRHVVGHGAGTWDLIEGEFS